MRRLAYLVFVVLIPAIFVPIGPIFGQSPKKMPPQAPITYPGDTEQVIVRRTLWVEGARKEGKLVWWGTNSPSEAKSIAAEFNKIYPFIKVEYWRGEGEEIAAKVEAETTAGRYTVDICLGGEPLNYPRWRAKGMIEKFIDFIPQSGLKMLDRRMYGKHGDWVMPSFGPKVPQYNTNLVSASDAPKNWEDLIHPRWKGQIGVNKDVKYWWTVALAEDGWGLEKTEAFLTKLKQQNPVWGNGLSQSHALLIAGEFKILAAGNLRHVILSQQKKAPVDWVRANPVVLTGASFSLRAKDPHPNSARLFMEWMLSPQGLQVWANVTAQYVPGTDTPTVKLMKGLSVIVRTEEVELKAVEMELDKRFANILGITAD